MKKISVLLIVMSYVGLSYCQKINELDWQPGIQSDYQFGWVLPVNPFLTGTNFEKEKILYFQAFSIELYKQTLGQHLWEQLYHYPRWGAGVAAYDFFNPEELGRPFTLYGFFSGDFFGTKRFSLMYSLRLGMGFNWHRFDPVSNPYNIVIGSKITVYADLGMTANYALTNQIDLGFGFSLAHFSNGALHYPNYGLNIAAPRITLGLRPKTNNYRNSVIKDIPPIKHSPNFLVSIYGGMHQVYLDTTNNNINYKYIAESFPTFGIFSELSIPISYKIKIGFGLNLGYDNAISAQMWLSGNDMEAREAPFIKRIQLSIFPSFTWVVDRFNVIMQPGFYLFRTSKDDVNPLFYQRLGLRYNFNKPFFLGVNIRAISFHKSQYIEWTIGYRFNSKEN